MEGFKESVFLCSSISLIIVIIASRSWFNVPILSCASLISSFSFQTNRLQLGLRFLNCLIFLQLLLSFLRVLPWIVQEVYIPYN